MILPFPSSRLNPQSSQNDTGIQSYDLESILGQVFVHLFVSSSIPLELLHPVFLVLLRAISSAMPKSAVNENSNLLIQEEIGFSIESWLVLVGGA